MIRKLIPWDHLLTLLSGIPPMFANWRRLFGLRKSPKQAAPATITPDSGVQGSAVTILVDDPTSYFEDSGYTLIIPDDGITIISEGWTTRTQWRVDITIAAAAPTTTRLVYVFVISGPPATGMFTVVLRETAIVILSPAGGAQGDTFPMQIIGQHTSFSAASQVSFSSPGVTAGNVIWVSATQLTVTVTIGEFAMAQRCDVIVTTGDEVATGAGLFNIIAATQKAVILREGVNAYLRQNHIADPLTVDICEVFIESVNQALRSQQVLKTALGVTVTVGVET